MVSCLFHLWRVGLSPLCLKCFTFMVSHYLHLWLIVITFMVGVAFMADSYYIYGLYNSSEVINLMTNTTFLSFTNMFRQKRLPSSV